MRLMKWLRLSWWQRTRLSAFVLAGIGGVLIFVLVIALSGLSQTAAIGRLQFIATTLFPLIVVMLIATKARLQRLINLRGNSEFLTSKTNRRSSS